MFGTWNIWEVRNLYALPVRVANPVLPLSMVGGCSVCHTCVDCSHLLIGTVTILFCYLSIVRVVANLGRYGRHKLLLLGRAWSVPVIRHIFSTLKGLLHLLSEWTVGCQWRRLHLHRIVLQLHGDNKRPVIELCNI